jgi:hypothetical protein
MNGGAMKNQKPKNQKTKKPKNQKTKKPKNQKTKTKNKKQNQPLMVFATPYPSPSAPSHSMTPPKSTACVSEIAPLPTEVPQLFAASFAPMPKHITNPTTCASRVESSRVESSR